MNKKGIFECMKDEQEFLYVYGHRIREDLFQILIRAFCVLMVIVINKDRNFKSLNLMRKFYQDIINLKRCWTICFSDHLHTVDEEFIEGIQPLITDHEAGEIKYC